MDLNLYKLSREKHLIPVSALHLAQIWPKERGVYWLDIKSTTTEELQTLLTPLNLHPLIMEDCLDWDRSSQLNRYDQALYLEFPANETGDPRRRPYVSIICLPQRLVTIRRGAIPFLDKLAADLIEHLQLYSVSKEAILYHILDGLIDQNTLLVINARDEVDQLMNAFDEDPGSIDVEDIQTLQQRVSRLTSIAEDQLYCVTNLQSVDSRAFSIGRQREYYRDLVSAGDRAIRFTNRLERRLNDLYEYYQLTLHDRAEARLRFLTVLSAIFLPLTLISSIYGMNFGHMPELKWQYGYFAVLGLMVLIGLGMLGLFYRRGWFE